MDFLAGAIEADSPEAFADYSQWTARMLGARGIGAHTLEENFVQLEKHLSECLARKWIANCKPIDRLAPSRMPSE